MGGGFGGVKAALELAGNLNYKLTLISDQDNFRYYPTLYRAAMGGSKTISSFPLGDIFHDKDINLVNDSAVSIDRQNKTVKTASGKSHSYDLLVIALGVVTNFFNIKGLDKYAFGIKTLEEAQRLRDHLHQQLVEDSKPDVNYIIIGGGATGVELAGALPHYIRHIMKNHGLKRGAVNVELVESAPRLMPRMPRPYSLALARRLRRLGVSLHLGQTVQAQTAAELMVNGKPLDSHTVVWTAGVTCHPFLKQNSFALSEHGKALVDKYLQAEPGIYVLGDNADTPYSGMAQTALHDGAFVANQLVDLASGKAPKEYRAKKPIYITPVGGRWAAMLWGRTQIYGVGAWALRGIADLAGFHDLQPIVPASKRWIAMANHEESCALCFRKPN